MEQNINRTSLDPYSVSERLNSFPPPMRPLLQERLKELQGPLGYCMFPGCETKQQNIKAHSISKRFLNRLEDNQQVYVWNDKLGTDITLVHCKSATTFLGVCGQHDQQFSLIDNNDLNISKPNEKYLFLLAYRAILKELYIQEKLWEKNKDKPVNVRIYKQKSSLDSGRRYKEKVDAIYKERDWKKMQHKIFPINTNPTIAVSSFFSLDDIDPLATPEAMVSVLPINSEKTVCIFSAITDHKPALLKYLDRNLGSEHNKGFRVRLSALLLRDTLNYVISPVFWNNLSEHRKKIITEFLSKTTYQGSRIDISRASKRILLFSTVDD